MHTHYTRARATGHENSEAGWEFSRPVVVPPAVLNLRLRGKLSGTEFDLLCVVDALGGEGGCVVPNAQLGLILGLSADHVSGLVGACKESGLLAVENATDAQGRPGRLLTVIWSKERADLYSRASVPDTDLDKRASVPDTDLDKRASVSGTDPVTPVHRFRPQKRRGITQEQGPEKRGERGGYKGGKGGMGLSMGIKEDNPGKDRGVEGGKKNHGTCSDSTGANPAEVAARRLYTTLELRRKLMSRKHYNPKTWARQMADTRAQVQDPERFDRVLDWYCHNLGGQYVPQAYSARAFGEKFIQIEQAMERDIGPTQVKDEAGLPAEDDKEAQAALRRLLTYEWPKGASQRLGGLVGKATRDFRAFRKALRAASKAEDDREVAKLAGYCFQAMHRTEEFVVQWFEDQHRRACHLRQWDGNLAPFDPRHRNFRNEGYDLAAEAGVPPAAWDRMVDRMEGASRES